MKVDLSKCDVKQRRMLAETISSNCIELDKLSKDSDAGVRANVAANRATSVSILRQLATDPAVDVRWMVAKNPNTPADLFTDFANDPALCVRQNAAKDPRTSAEGLMILIKQDDFRINGYLAMNPNVTPEMEAEIYSNMLSWERTAWEARRNPIVK